VPAFEQAITEADVVFIVGTGLSAATTNGAPTSTWVGLVRSGAERAAKLNNRVDEQWLTIVQSQLDYPSTDMVINAASSVASAIRELGDTAYAAWLREDVGDLVASDEAVASALLSYPFPVLTTNYDKLLEQVGGRETRDWTDSRGFQDVVTRSSSAIGHIHGVWDRPDSVILTAADYARLSTHESMQALEKAMATLKSIVYVGFGSGLGDPNFASLLEWHRRVFPQSSTTHYRLCRTDELDELRRLHANDHVVPVAYGDQHADLAPFLARHAPASESLITNAVGLARDVVQEARELIRDSMTNESVLVDTGADDLVRRDLTIPPILLPVPHATFVRDRLRRGDTAEVERLDPHREIESHDFFVVVGDEGSGLTTAVKWLATQSSELLGTAAPIYVRFSECRHRSDPLGAATRNAAMNCGLIHDRGASLPDHIIAIDDFRASVPRLSDTVLGQVVASDAIVKIIGCHQGEEDELATKLNSLGVSPRILFLGRMRKTDVKNLAERLAPGQGNRLADEALKVLEAEGLRRTPLTVSLLLYLALRGSAHDTRNQTSMLDAYTLLLLGIGNPHENTTGLTETDLEAVLGKFAESLIWDEKPSLSEPEAVRVIADVIQKFGWQANATHVLDFFLQRRLLRRHGDSIEFARYAYFTLFAAKRALVDPEFRDLVVNDLFYYQPVAVKLSALSRADEDLLQRIRPLIDEELAVAVSPGSPYEPTPLITIDELPPPEEVHRSTDALERVEDGDDLEFPESDSVGSFGLVKASMSPPARLHRVLTLISTVIRDLDQIENLELKKELLVDTVELWGRFITVLSSDSSLGDLRSAVARHLETEGGTDGDDNADLVDFLSRSIPAGTVIGGMEMTLSSPKLASVLESAINAGELSRTNERLTATLLLLFLQRSPGWAKKAASLIEEAEPTWVVTHFFHALCQDAYAQGATPEEDALHLCKTVYLKQQSFASPDIRSAHLDRYAHRLRTMRAKNKYSPPTSHTDT